MNKKNIFCFIALMLVFSSLFTLLFGCKKKVQVKEYSFYYEYFDTYTAIYDYSGKSDKKFEEAKNLFSKHLEYYHKLFDIYNEYDGMNNVATVNRLAGKEAVKVDSELIKFLEFSKEMYNLTDGNVNIAMGSVLSIWHKYREEGKSVPDKEQLSEAAKHMDINNLIIDKTLSTVYFSDPEMSLDVGAIAKGYTAERIANELENAGYSSYVVDLGGNLRTIGTKRDGGRWRTGVENPDPMSRDKYIYYLDIADVSVVTSGDYQRFYYVDGKKYHHIINKDTLMPAGYFSSVTIITKNSGVADALSTAIFNMDYETGLSVVSKMDDVSVVWYTTDGKLLTYNIDKYNANNS